MKMIITKNNAYPDEAAVIEAAIRKAVGNGYLSKEFKLMEHEVFPIRQYAELLADPDKANAHFALIYDHDFARALWGTQPLHSETRDIMNRGEKIGESDYTAEAWIVHLKKMVVIEYPIEYLADNI